MRGRLCQGVVHLVVIEARNLTGADSSVIGSSRSDPYCNIQGFQYEILDLAVLL